MITPSQDPNFPLLQNLLTWASKRQQALGSNLANLDTPGYKAKDYTFESQLQSIAMKSTSTKHIAPIEDSPNARMIEVGTKEKLNGNTVDIERELTEITKNGVGYITFVQFLNHKVRTLRSAIVDGGKI
jgi:flagellar basal-body rod protein FlgB